MDRQCTRCGSTSFDEDERCLDCGEFVDKEYQSTLLRLPWKKDFNLFFSTYHVDNYKEYEFLRIESIDLNGRTTRLHDRSGWVIGHDVAIAMTIILSIFAGWMVVFGDLVFFWFLAMTLLLVTFLIYSYYQTLYNPPDIWK